MIIVIDYRTGNLSSIVNMIKKLGHVATISSDPAVIKQATKIILPGVGHYDYGMRNLRSVGLVEILDRKVLIEKVPVLGICLGVQLLMKGSEEGREPGLGWIDGYTRAFDKSRLPQGYKIPHMGWSEVNFKNNSRLATGFSEVPRFYFVHSFHLVCERESDALLQCEYGYPFTAGVEHENIVGVQFHPEKSHKFGMKIMENFIRHY